jgi:hypothetical protein
MEKLHYLSPNNLRDRLTVTGQAREIEVAGRRGLQPTSIHTRMQLNEHTLNNERGSVTLWVLPMEDLSSFASIQHMHKTDPGYDIYPILSDNENVRDWQQATFAWTWAAHWYPQWWAKFYKGSIYPDGFDPNPRAVVLAGHFNFRAMRWVQLGLTWDKAASQYRLYANGVLVSTSNQFARSLEAQTCGKTLFLGEPAMAFSELNFYDACLDAGEMAQRYSAEAVEADAEMLANLRRTFAGADPQPFDWHPDASWTLRLDLPMNEPGTLDHFYVQGNTDAPSVTPDGLLVHTPERVDGDDDRAQVYLWTRQAFENDLAIEFDFKPEAPNGLSLLMLQASGLHREDFMEDYPLRTTGSMAVVYCENVRNYHWEFFRGMDDTRNDVASSALIKQPWNRPLAYWCGDRRLALDEWHRIQFVQHGARLRGAIDGVIVFDVRDESCAFTGSHYNCGHLAIRCMIKTRNIYRNLRVWTPNI